ncbi:hypothetical protein ACFL2O_03035 [Thermodesulfobacteriota bacterium]
MKRASESGQNFKLIQGGLRTETLLGNVRVVAAPEKPRPFDVDAIVCEEDTWLVMSADPEICIPEIHPIRLMTELIEAKPKTPGRVLIRQGNPIRFLAVVHDFNMDPTWKEEWIDQALSEIFKESEKRKMKAVGIPLLCTRHGRLDVDRFLSLITDIISGTSFKYLKRLWLITSKGLELGLIDRLEKKGGEF